MSLLAQVFATPGPWYGGSLVAGCFTLLGAMLGAGSAVSSAVLLDRRKAQREENSAKEARRRDAYLRILTYLALTRDELRRAIDERRPFNHQFVNEREQAELDALSELDTSQQFRHLLRLWPDAFHAALNTYEDLRLTELRIRESESEEHAAREILARQLEEHLRELRTVIEDIRRRARTDTSSS